ncbi:MAG TPA: hypothetical protein VMV81_02155 [Phycisphaerae bacterium]|nr:hypothetical protein [Phycisphaerae bacterium]
MNVVRTRSNASGNPQTEAAGRAAPKRWRIRVAAAFGIIVLAGAYALLRTPNWYTLPAIAPQERQAVRDNLIAAEAAFTEALRTSTGAFVYHVFQDDVNRWVAMRREIYPLIDELAPPELIDPIVLFEPGEITIAGRYRKLGTDLLVSVDIAVSSADDGILLRVTRMRCGSIGVPVGFASLGLKRSIDRPAGSVWPGSPHMWGSFADGFHVDAKGWWKNGGVDYRVRDVTLEAGVLHLNVEPLGHSSRREKRQG